MSLFEDVIEKSDQLNIYKQFLYRINIKAINSKIQFSRVSYKIIIKKYSLSRFRKFISKEEITVHS